MLCYTASNSRTRRWYSWMKSESTNSCLSENLYQTPECTAGLSFQTHSQVGSGYVVSWHGQSVPSNMSSTADSSLVDHQRGLADTRYRSGSHADDQPRRLNTRERCCHLFHFRVRTSRPLGWGYDIANEVVRAEGQKQSSVPNAWVYRIYGQVSSVSPRIADCCCGLSDYRSSIPSGPQGWTTPSAITETYRPTTDSLAFHPALSRHRQPLVVDESDTWWFKNGLHAALECQRSSQVDHEGERHGHWRVGLIPLLQRGRWD